MEKWNQPRSESEYNQMCDEGYVIIVNAFPESFTFIIIYGLSDVVPIVPWYVKAPKYNRTYINR